MHFHYTLGPMNDVASPASEPLRTGALYAVTQIYRELGRGFWAGQIQMCESSAYHHTALATEALGRVAIASGKDLG